MLKNFEAENIIENLYNSNKVLGVIITHALNIEYFDKAYGKLWHEKVIPTNIRPALSSVLRVVVIPYALIRECVDY